MADQYDWSGIFDDVPEGQAIPEYPTGPGAAAQNDWSGVFDDPYSPNQDDDAVGWGKGTGWDTFEAMKPLTEGVKSLGKMVQTTMAAPAKVAADVGRRITGLPAPGDIQIDWDTVPEDKIKSIKLIQDMNELVETIGTVSSPGQAILGILKVAGALEPDMEYQLRKQGKALEVQVAEDFIATGPQMVMNIFAGKVGGPLGVLMSSGSQIYGAAFERHSEKNEPIEAAALAFMDAIPQVAIESLSTLFMLGGLKAFKPLMQNKVMAKLAKSLDKKPVNWIKAKLDTTMGRIVGSISGEGAEEYAQSIIEMGSDLVQMKMDGKTITGPAITALFKEKHEEGKYAAIIGALWGGAAGGPMAIMDRHNPLKDANDGDVDETKAPDDIETKQDAKALLEEVGRRMVEGEDPIDEAPSPIVVDVEAQDIQLEEGAPGAETDVDYGVVFDKEAMEEPLGYTIDRAAGEEGFEGFGLKEDEMYITITDEKSPAFKGTIVTTPGNERASIAKTERQFLAGKKDVEGYVEHWMANPETRPDWADKRPQAKGKETPQVKAWDSGVRLEAQHAYKSDRGDKTIVLESEAVKELRNSLNDGENEIFSKLYKGDDWVNQVDESELDTVSLGAKKLIEAFFGVPVFPVKWSQKVMDDADSPLHRHHGARTFDSGAITFVVGDDPIRMLNSIFHEKSHDLKKTNPELHKEAADWIYANSSHPKIKEALIDLQRTYKDADAEKLEDELVAKVKGELASMEKYQIELLAKLKKEDPTLYNKIVDFMLDILKDIKAFITQNGDSSEGYKSILNDVDAAIDFFTDLDVKEFKAGTAGRMENVKLSSGKSGKLGGLMQNIVDNEKKSKTFFSAMNKFLFGGKQPKIQGKKLKASNVKAQLVAWAKAGEFKMAELNWSPVLEWLDTKKIVSAKDVETYMKENNVIVTSGILKESGMTAEDIKEDLGRLETEISMVESNIDSMFYDYTFIGSGIEVPESILFTVPDDTVKNEKGRRFRLTDNGEVDVIEDYLTDNKEYLNISDDLPDIVQSIRSVMTNANGLKDAIGVAAGKSQYGPEEYPNLTTAGGIQDYAEMTLKLDLPQARINKKKYERLDKPYIKISSQILKMHDDLRKHKDDWSEEVLTGVAKAVVAKTSIKQRIGAKMRELGGKMDSFYYEGGHYRGPVLGHIRLTSRYVGDKLVLFIEEVQSDWQQRGRKAGFKSEEKVTMYGSRKIYTPIGFSWKKTVDLKDATTQHGKEILEGGGIVLHQLIRDKNGEVVSEATDKIHALDRAGIKQAEMVPDTPFKPFSELALKKIARIAVDSGHDYVAWTPAAEHIRRYNLAKYVDSLEYNERDAKPVLKGWKDGGQVGTWTIEEGHTLEDYVGQTIGGELRAQLGEHKTTALLSVDEDTQVGDFEWAVNLYDKMIPRIANKLFGKKSWGNARVRELEVDVSEGEEGKVVIQTRSGNIMSGYSSLHELLANYEGESWDLVIEETDDARERVMREEPNYANKIGFLEQQITDLEYLKAADAVFFTIHDEPMKVLGFPVTKEMKEITTGGQVLFDMDAPRKGIPVSAEQITEGDGAALNLISRAVEGKQAYIESDDYGTQDIASSLGWLPAGKSESNKALLKLGDIVERDAWDELGPDTAKSMGLTDEQYEKFDKMPTKQKGVVLLSLYMEQKSKIGAASIGNLYEFDERIPKNADIIAGMYQASWHVDLKSKRSTKELYRKIFEPDGELKGYDMGEVELAKYPEKLKNYLNQSWRTYRAAADGTSKGDFLPSKNVLLRPSGIESGKGRQLLVQISSDFKTEGASNIGDSYYEALYSKREGYLRPSRDFWELPEWMTRMAYFMPDADVYVIRNINEAKQFFNQAGYDTIFFSVLDITKAPVKSIAESYSGDILAGGYLPDGSYYKGMKNVTWVEDMPAAAKELGVEYKNGVDYRHFKNTKTIPRLEMSKGCLHKCAFCSQDRFLTVSSPEAITQQIKEYKAFDYEIVYLNDKTFGQAENYPDLVNIKKEIQAVNPNFKGFVIQTTATQYNKMPDEFLQNSGIVYVELGVETFNDKQLASLSKPHREEHILEAAEKIRRLKQVFVPNVMVGLAGKNKDGSTWVESVRTYGRTLKFLNDNRDIISHLNIGVLAAETGTKLHAQLDAVESDQDEHQSSRSWLKNQKIHDRFFEQLSAMGEEQLDSVEVKDYVKKSIKINTEIKEQKWYRGSRVDALIKMPERGAYYFSSDKDYAGTYGKIVNEYDLSLRNTWAVGNYDPEIKKMMEDHSEFPDMGLEKEDYHDWAVLEDPKIRKAMIKAGYDSYFTNEGGGSIGVYSKDIISKHMEERKDGKKVTGEVMFDLVSYREGSKQSESYHKAYFDIFNIAKKARGMNKVRAYLERQKEMYDLPVTEELIKNIGNHADKLAKNKKKMLKFKKLVTLREGIAAGLLDPRDPKVIKRMEKHSNFMPYTIRHTGGSFYIGERMKYGKFTDKVTLFDEGSDVARLSKKPYIDPVTGAKETMEKFYNKEGVRLIKAPIFSTNKAKRINEIKAIVKKNIRYADWYRRWKDFVFQFAEEGKSDIEIKRIAAISGLLGAGKSPQIQQGLWADTINKLTSGRKPRKAAKNEFAKIMDIWSGKYDEVLGKTDDEGILEIQRVFGRKIGPYLAAAVDPSSPNVLVLDRHMPKGWGYNVLHSVGKQQGAFNMHPSIEHEIASDIFQVAKEMEMDVAGVQAALWFDFRTPASDVSDIVNIAQIEPGKYVPYVWHKRTFPAITTGIHYKKTDLKLDDYVLGSTPRGKAKFNTYSRTDIGRRIHEVTKKWPYQPAVYMYTPEATPEPQIRQGSKGYTFKYDPSEIYDGVKDPYLYWDEAIKQLKQDPGANLTNIFLKLVSDREQYNGVLVRSPYDPGLQKWLLIFEKAAVQDYPELTQVGISDVIEKEETTPQDIDEAVLFMTPRSKFLTEFMKEIAAEKRYHELTFSQYFPTLARFEEATSDMLEPGLSVKIEGPLRSQRAFLSEIAIARGQRQVHLMHEPRADSSYPSFIDYSEGKLFSFKVKREWDNNPAGLIKALEKSGLKEFNIVESTVTRSLTIEQFVSDVNNIAETVGIIEKFAEPGYPRNKVIDVHSEMLSENDYKDSIIEYWGQTKGEEIYKNAIEKGREFSKEVRSGAHKKRIASEIERVRKAKGIDKPSDTAGIQEDIEGVSFKKWFKGSKVIDEDGNPMAVYHGTWADFKEFDIAGSEFGSHFGTARQADLRHDAGREVGKRMYPVYLSIKNPVRLKDWGHFSPNAYIDQLRNKGALTEEEFDRIDEDELSGKPHKEIHAEVRDILLKRGYDGITYLNRREGIVWSEFTDAAAVESDNEISDTEFKQKHPTAEDSWIAFQPNQIKSIYSKKFSSSYGILEDIEPETKDLLDRVGRKDISIVDKVMAKADYKKGTFITSTADKLNPLRMAVGGDTPAYMLHRGLPGIQSSINALLEHGRLTLDDSGVLTTDTKNKGFLPWIKSLGKNPDKFWYWVIVRRDSSRQERDKKYTPMFTEEERARLLNWTGTKNEDGKSWQAFNKEFQEYNQSVLDIGIKSGLLDPAMVRQFKDQFYIPFYRIFENEQATAEFIKAPVNTKRIIAAQIKKLHGSKRQMGDPLENILANWSHLLKQSMTNASRKAAFNELTDAKALSETGEPIIEEVPWKDTVIFKSGKDDKTTFVYEKQGIEVLGFKDNGKTRFFKVNDPELFQALSLVPNAHMPRWLAAILGAPKALLTFGATITPSFVIANTTRDTMHTFTISKNFIPFWDTMRGFVKTLAKDKDYVEYMASGNSFVGSYIKADRPEAFAKFAKKIVKREGRGALGRILNSPAKLYNFWETFTEASENAARLALYSNLKKAGKTKLEASFAARDIMDFQKRGASPVVQYLTQTVPFLNARIQGLVKMGQAAAKNPGMYTLKGGMIAMASLALWAAYKDDDRYKELEDWERFAYYHFWIGEHHFRIPKPFETGVIWSSAWTAAADVMTGNDEADHITSFIGASLLDTFAFNPIPQAARPIMEQYFNKTFFTGRPIVPQGMKYREPGERYYPWDHESAIILGKALGVSPRRIQALVRGYLAGLGVGIMAGTDIMVRQFAEFPERPTTDIGTYPMIGRFVKKGPAKYTKYQSKFYDTFEALNQLSRKVQIAQQAGEWKSAADITKLNRKKLDAFSRAKNVKRILGQNRKNVQQVWMDPHMSGDVKKLRLDSLAIERNKAVKEFWDWYLENV